jgi:hypothetical protein
VPQIAISDKLNTKLEAFKKVIDVIAEIKPDGKVNYAEIVMMIGIERMLRDVFPAENKVLQESMLGMFERNPQFVSEFIADTLQAGEPRKEVKDKWNTNQYIQ